MIKILLILFSIQSSLAATKLNHMLHIPSSLKENPNLVVVIHGCLQNSSLISASTNWNKLSDKEGFLVLYPDQKFGRNPYNCWNWFESKNQIKEGEEPKDIVNLVKQVQKEFNVNKKKTFVVGMSSGSGMAGILASCYPKLWAGIGLHSGPAYASATNANEILEVLKYGPKKEGPKKPCNSKLFSKPVVIFHGSEDKVVHPKHAIQSAKDFSKGESLSSKSFPSSKVSRAYTISKYTGINKNPIILYTISGLEHAWSGGNKFIPFSDHLGPNATNTMWDVFKNDK